MLSAGYIKEYAMRTVALKGKIRGAYTISCSKLKGWYVLEDPGEDGRTVPCCNVYKDRNFGIRVISIRHIQDNIQWRPVNLLLP
jgi:hypothetical protein